MTIKLAPPARRQFLEGLEYIRQDSPTVARQFRLEAGAVLGRLMEFPDSGRAIPEFPELPHREVIVRPSRFIFRVVGKTVWIVAVWRSAWLP